MKLKTQGKTKISSKSSFEKLFQFLNYFEAKFAEILKMPQDSRPKLKKIKQKTQDFDANSFGLLANNQ